jgi:hypothetical protein
LKGVPPSDASNSGEGGCIYAAICRLEVPRNEGCVTPVEHDRADLYPPFGGVPRPYRYASREVVLGAVEEP